MNNSRSYDLIHLCEDRYEIAKNIIHESSLKTASKRIFKLPGLISDIPFGQFTEKEYVALIIDIRKSKDIITNHGAKTLFIIFYILSSIVSNSVKYHNGLTTEYLGDGVLNLFLKLEKSDGVINSLLASIEIFETKYKIFDPFLQTKNLPSIKFGIGVDYGVTIITKFGEAETMDLKSFGNCIFIADKLSKQSDNIVISHNLWKNYKSNTQFIKLYEGYRSWISKELSMEDEDFFNG